MCYSKEVSLAAGSIIASGSIYSWFHYCRNAIRSKIDVKLYPFYRDVILGISCIGMHQLFEYFAISSGSQLIYKSGLVWSIMCMYFIMRSVESLTHIKFASRTFLFVITVITVDIFRRDMTFQDTHFWVRGNSHMIWAAAWMLLFIYWNASILYLRTVTKSKRNKRLLLWYPFAVLNFSFFLSLIYAYSSALVQQSNVAFSLFSFLGMANVMNSFKVVQDSPSIWCVFASTQVITIPIFFYFMHKYYEVDAPLRIRSVSKLTEVKLVALDLVIWIILFFSLPIFPGVALKMLLK